jgi:hypothetical protein
VTISTLTAPKRFPQGIKIGRLCDGNDRPGHDNLTSGPTERPQEVPSECIICAAICWTASV